MVELGQLEQPGNDRQDLLNRYSRRILPRDLDDATEDMFEQVTAELNRLCGIASSTKGT